MTDPFQTFNPEQDAPPSPPGREEANESPRPVVRPSPAAQPERIGRYRLDKVLGEGAFGRVYLATDEQLNRSVAMKVPRLKRISRPEEAEAYLAEARVVASLDHPNIVPVFDVGTTPEGLCFVVSKVIEGSDLAKFIASKRVTHNQAADLTASIASALHYAHRKGLVHRDIKPANILLDTGGVCYVADFGLALREEDYGKGLAFAGTPAYMSPEQARSEGHRVDGRSDIFSLGIIFYEMLVGRRPFKGDTLKELLEAITSLDVRPPRQIDDTISKELERICLKALAKRASERYTTAKDLADDLRHYLSQTSTSQPLAGHGSVSAIDQGPRSLGGHLTAMSHGGFTHGSPVSRQSMGQAIDIVPRGLRSFDAEDADSFLDLLPGPRDRNGLPDSLRFWKNRIEERDADKTFAVGLIYGPSGCGKSSLVKAGLLPRLAMNIVTVYIEATGAETETRLLNGLRKRCPDLPSGLDLKDSLAALRRGEGMDSDTKVLLVIDQFEQWLHAKRDAEETRLVQALRQCDGGRVQCILMVRDDFWMSVTRFLTELEIELVQGNNFAAADLFDLKHAEKVLGAFGRAYTTLPFEVKETTKEQKEFLKLAIAGLAQEGKVICVRLALFAEMMKGKVWTPATLKEMGGTAGVGITFLEETFSSSGANPRHRFHQKAARAVLKELLPESGTDIKGHMRSYAELLQASGYTARPKEFDDLIRILDTEIRLITPTDPEGADDDDKPSSRRRKSAEPVDASAHYFQLTHDYLVPSLRDWLTHKQKETRRGRAELALADRAGVWISRPESRQLPSLWQWLSIRSLTRKKTWTAPERKMMRAAVRYHVIRATVVVGFLIAVLMAGLGIRDHNLEQRQAVQATEQVKRLLDADTLQVPAIIAEMAPFRPWADPLLKQARGESDVHSQHALHTSLALLPVDASQKDYLAQRLLAAAPRDVAVLCQSLAPHKESLLETFWTAAERPDAGKESQRLRAASALATYDPESPRWSKSSAAILDQLVVENPMFLGLWMDGLRPVKGHLLMPLTTVYRDASRRESERALATSILADYAADQPQLLADLLVDADEKQFAVLFPKLKAHGDRGAALLQSVVATRLSSEPREILRKDGEIAKDDPKVAMPSGQSLPVKTFDVSLQAGKTYRIAMTSKKLDSFLLLQDKNGKALATDDDSGGELNSQMMYASDRDDAFKIVAASLKGAGPFVLTVDEIVSEDDKEKLAKRQANAAVGLLRMNQPASVWPLLKHGPDPRVRSYLIHRLGPLGANAADLVKRLDAESDISIQRALILSLGEFGEKAFLPSERTDALRKIQEIYTSASDPGLHGAAEWLLRRWHQSEWLTRVETNWVKNKDGREKRLATIESQAKAEKAKAKPQWYVTGEGQTMVVIPGPVEFLMGSPPAEAKRQATETRHLKKIDRSFAIASKAVTVGEYRRFEKGYQFTERYAPTPDCPAVSTTWYQAAAYCNWLSEQEGIESDQWCYETNLRGQVTRLKPKYLSLAGYRLPTEAEMEYAMRAGATTSRFFGESDELLGKYAWYLHNSSERSWPVGSKMPNDLGLFDTLGNVWCWCQDANKVYPQGESGKVFSDHEMSLTINLQESRVLRGGSFDDQGSYLRSAYRNTNVPTFRFNSYGFRVARTIGME